MTQDQTKPSDPKIVDAIDRAQQFSPFLSKSMTKNQSSMPLMKQGQFDAAWDEALQISSDDIGETLRRQRSAMALIAAIADLSGHWDLTKVTRKLSDFADHALDAAIHAAFGEYLAGQPVQGFAVIALGKHGGRELNYSSDIDPIFIYDPKTLPVSEGGDPSKIAVRIGKRIISLLSERTEHDYVFRVDMRLRPASEITPVAISVNAAISHYESSALAWEQAAFIRSRTAAGDRKLGQYFLDAIDTFIWRRSLDFGQIDNIRKMSNNIRDHYSKGQKFGAGYDLKRGRGGIRECEFFAQVHQLIHGGRNASLRVSDTRGALLLLAQQGHISETDAQILSDGYALLRTTEHRLQMVNDRQTHQLPDSDEALDNVARLQGLANGADLIESLQSAVQNIQNIYDALVQDNDKRLRLAEDGVPLIEQLQDMGYGKDAAQLVQYWRSGKYRAIRSEAAKTSFENLLPDILAGLSNAPDPQKALSSLDRILEKLPSAINFFSLLQNRPGILQLLGDILSYAPTLADALGRNAALLDGLIDNSNNLPHDQKSIIAQMQRYFHENLDYQSLLDAVRNFVAEKRFALGVQLIEGRADPNDAAIGYSALAEAAMDVLTRATIREFEAVHGRVAGGELLIIALGRFGGRALTHASDLDIIFLFTGKFSAESDGKRPLGATQYFGRLAQRVIAALSVPTASGALYEVDTRLRPSGAQGLLCVSLDSFEKYQRENAWTWEHMALTRARTVFGSDKARHKVQDIVKGILNQKRDDRYAAIASMRREMDKHKPAISGLDVKNAKGGLIDIEFIVHAYQLHHICDIDPNIERSIIILADQKLLPHHILEAHIMMSKMLILLRLICPDLQQISEPAKQLLAQNLGYDDWKMLRHQLEDHQAKVIEQWQYSFSEPR